jgi:peptidyl-prolyl cis-trans isomerase SurA
MVLGLAQAAQGAIVLDKIMAIVNKEVITWSDLYKGMEFDAAEDIKALKPEDKRRVFKENEMTYLDNLIEMKLQLQEAGKAGIGAGKNDVDIAIRTIRDKYAMTDVMFEEMIRKEGFSLTDYRKKIAEQITIGRVIDQEVRSKVLVTEREIDAYLSEHKDAAANSEGFAFSHIFLRATENKKAVEEKAQDIYKKIKAGESFSDLARHHSEDRSARAGGDLGFIRKSEMSKDFLNVLGAMNAGEVSEPFWSESGMHILKVNEVVAYKTPQELREAIRQKLLNEKFTREYRNWVKGLREKAYVEVKI